MKLRLLILSFCFVQSFMVFAQNLDKEKRLKLVADNIPFPEVYVNIKIGFNAEMLDISKLPLKNRYNDLSISELETAHSGGDNNLALLLELYYRYIAKEDTEKAYQALLQAYEMAMAAHKADPSDFNAQNYLSDILFLIERKQDIVPMWESYVAKNPKSAKGWSKLGLFQLVNNNDSSSALKSIEKALVIDAEEPEIYSTAMSLMLKDLLLKAQNTSDDNYPINLSFFENAVKKFPKSKLAIYNFEVATVVKFFYDNFFDIAVRANKGEKGPRLSAAGEKQLLRLKKSMQGFAASKQIVNKFAAYKCLLLLDVLKGQTESAADNSKSAIAIIGTDTEILRLLSIVHSMKADYEKAAAFMQKATAGNPLPPDLFALTRMHFEADNFEESFLLLKKLNNSYPNYYDFIFGIVSVKMAELNFDEACKLLNEMKQYFTPETKIEEHPYYIFYDAVCILINDSTNSKAISNLQRISNSQISWAANAKKLLELFK